jgi:prolipoprotein diacylglyceryltransferase
MENNARRFARPATWEQERTDKSKQEVDMVAFTVFGAPEWLSVIIVVGIVAATIYFVRRAI